MEDNCWRSSSSVLAAKRVSMWGPLANVHDSLSLQSKYQHCLQHGSVQVCSSKYESEMHL
eukprot:3624011-Amphidinium_carterae.2